MPANARLTTNAAVMMRGTSTAQHAGTKRFLMQTTSITWWKGICTARAVTTATITARSDCLPRPCLLLNLSRFHHTISDGINELSVIGCVLVQVSVGELRYSIGEGLAFADIAGNDGRVP